MFQKESLQFFLVGAIVVVVCVSFVVFTADDARRILLSGPAGQGQGVERTLCSSTLVVVSATGERDVAVQGRPLDLLVVAVQSGPRAPAVDLSGAMVEVSRGERVEVLEPGRAAGPGTFALIVAHDADGSLNPGGPVLTAGDFVELRVDLGSAGMALEERGRLTFVLDCGGHGRVESVVEAPVGFGGANVVRLHQVDPG